jgi:hypothetical protein
MLRIRFAQQVVYFAEYQWPIRTKPIQHVVPRLDTDSEIVGWCIVIVCQMLHQSLQAAVLDVVRVDLESE